jgi:hypothetical protein
MGGNKRQVKDTLGKKFPFRCKGKASVNHSKRTVASISAGALPWHVSCAAAARIPRFDQLEVAKWHLPQKQK